MAERRRYYRVWCGKKRYTHWLSDEDEAFRAAVRHDLASRDRRGGICLGPLTWIEHGERAYARSKTVVVDRPGRSRR